MDQFSRREVKVRRYQFKTVRYFPSVATRFKSSVCSSCIHKLSCFLAGRYRMRFKRLNQAGHARDFQWYYDHANSQSMFGKRWVMQCHQYAKPLKITSGEENHANQ